jgi:hypothetical protein
VPPSSPLRRGAVLIALSRAELSNTVPFSQPLQKIAGYWAMGKPFRGAYLVLDSVQTRNDHFHSYFVEEYRPELQEMSADQDLLAPPGLRARPVYEACKFMEGQYYHLAAAIKLPR